MQQATNQEPYIVKIIRYVYGSLARTPKNEPEMWGNPKSKSQKGYYCMQEKQSSHRNR